MTDAASAPGQARTIAWLVGIVAAAFAASLPAWANQGYIFLAGLIFIDIVFALAWNLLFGFTGLVSFGQAAYFAVGAYFIGVIISRFPEVPFLLALLGAGVMGAVISVLIGLVALRRATGIYFAILTLALGEMVSLVISYSDALGREDGLTGVVRPTLLGIDLAAGSNYYYFLLLACLSLAGILWWVVHGPIGRVFRAIRQDQERVAFLGINVQRYRLLSFVIAGTVTALAGALYGPWAQIITPDVAHWSFSARPILYSLLGGIGSFWGPAVGAVSFVLIEFATRTMQGLSEIVIGGLLLIIVLAFPGGIMGLAQRTLRRRRVGAAPGMARQESEG